MSEKPNILIIWGDDIGQSNLSCYSDGVMGYRTPNIDRIADEGALFTDYYGEQSCTAGRAAFITGQNPYRTGLTKVGLPGADARPAGRRTRRSRRRSRRRATRPASSARTTSATATSTCPRCTASTSSSATCTTSTPRRSPSNRTIPKDPEFRKKFGPRGVLHTWANGDGTQRIEDTGPLTKKRMETCDDEFRDAAVDFIKRQHEADTPFFVWFNSTHMHFRTHPKPESIGRAGRWQSVYHDTMIDHDDIVGSLLDTARRPRHRRQHDRHVLHRQRPAHELVARCRHDAVPQREELQLGRRLPGSGDGALAGDDPGRARC